MNRLQTYRKSSCSSLSLILSMGKMGCSLNWLALDSFTKYRTSVNSIFLFVVKKKKKRATVKLENKKNIITMPMKDIGKNTDVHLIFNESLKSLLAQLIWISSNGGF